MVKHTAHNCNNIGSTPIKLTHYKNTLFKIINFFK